MADSWEEGNGENVTNQEGEEDDFLSVEDGVAASVAKEVYHVYDSDDADTSDDEYHEARDNLRAYGETRRRRKVHTKRAADGEEVDQLDEFEDVEVESGEEEEAENDNGAHGEDVGEDAVGGDEPRNEATIHSISNQEPPIQEQAVGENSNDSFYRLSEDSDHDVILNVADRRTIERELRIATSGVGVYVNERTGNQYVRLNGAAGRPVRGPQPTVVDLHGSQPPPSQP
ncbi:unnamed protein product [Linum trigynum]|uniref:Uncharacterized protein n=1 Tax=Linum trigynum TaxID=586398 RepID=A0AAV2GXS8_9ROSI